VGYNDDYNSNYQNGWNHGPSPSNGNALDAYHAGAAAHSLYNASVAAQNAAHQPVAFTPFPTSTPPQPSGSYGSYGSYGSTGSLYAGGYNPSVGSTPLSGGANGLLLLVMAGVLGWSSGLVAVVGLVIGSVAGALVGALLIWPAVRLMLPQRVAFGRAYSASLTAICLYAALLYLLTHFGGPVLKPIDARLQHWIHQTPWLGSLRSQSAILTFLVLTQVPALLLAAGTLRWRLRASLSGVRGSLLAAVFTVATAGVLLYGAAYLIGYSNHVVAPRAGVVSHHIR
jgi:hypothetical protein